MAIKSHSHLLAERAYKSIDNEKRQTKEVFRESRSEQPVLDRRTYNKIAPVNSSPQSTDIIYVDNGHESIYNGSVHATESCGMEEKQKVRCGTLAEYEEKEWVCRPWLVTGQQRSYGLTCVDP